MSETAVMGERVSRRVVEGHRISWFVWAWNDERREKMPHNSHMAGTWGWDAECECGWSSATGGATRGSVEREVRGHKYDVTDDWRML